MRLVAAMMVSLLFSGLLLLASAVAKKSTASKAIPVQVPPAGNRAAEPQAQPKAKTPPDTAVKATVPKPKDTWSASEIAAAQKVCKAILHKYKAIATPVTPIKKGRCGDPAPIKLIQIGKRPVSFSPPPTLNCRMVAALGKWISGGLQPLAKKHLGSRLREISVMSSYACRNRYGRPSARLSEHAKANALDIGGFEFEGGNEVRLLAHWGPTRRDLVARANASKAAPSGGGSPAPDVKGGPVAPKPGQQVAAAANRVPGPAGRALGATADALKSGATPRSAIGHGAISVFAERFRQVILPPLPERRPSLKERMQWAQLERRAQLRRAAKERQRLKNYRAKLNKFLYPSNQLGGPKSTRSITAGKIGAAKAKLSPTAFLRAAHRSACRYFGTVLGPEANEAHRNHFHVDLAPRRHKNFCE